MKSIKLNSGHMMPQFGLGTWKSKPGEVTAAVSDAIDAGYRHIDCAYCYRNENEVGEALARKFKDGTVKREDIFITSKLWATFHSKDLVLKNLKITLKDLGLDYLDLYLIHWPMGYKEGCDPTQMEPKDADGKVLYSDVDYVESWLAMEELVKLGLVRSIGVSNFSKPQIERILEAGTIVPANNQVECHPQVPQKELFAWCQSKGISVTAYSPLGSPDRPWAKPDDPILMEHPTVLSIAKKHNKTAAQVLIAFQLQRGFICIPKSVTKSRILSNMEVFDFTMSAADIATLEAMDRGFEGRVLHLNWVKDHKYWPFNTPF